MGCVNCWGAVVTSTRSDVFFVLAGVVHSVRNACHCMGNELGMCMVEKGKQLVSLVDGLEELVRVPRGGG